MVPPSRHPSRSSNLVFRSRVSLLRQVLTDESDGLTPAPDEEASRLIRVWSWVDRIEELCGGGMGAGPDPEGDWPVGSLLDAGVMGILDRTQAYQDEGSRSSLDPVLGCHVYSGRGRRAALRACGWCAEGAEGAEGGGTGEAGRR